MIDNYNNIKHLLTFPDDDTFYFLSVIQRKKENLELGSNSKVIKNYYINSIEYLESKYEEIKNLCNIFNARAMLRLNKRSYEKVAFKTMVNLANSMSNKEYSFIKKSYDRACGESHNDKNKKWILDIDNQEVSPIMLAFIDHECNPIGSKIYDIIPSKSGYHIITKPFDTQEFSKKFPEVIICKDNPTNLYIS